MVINRTHLWPPASRFKFNLRRVAIYSSRHDICVHFLNQFAQHQHQQRHNWVVSGSRQFGLALFEFALGWSHRRANDVSGPKRRQDTHTHTHTHTHARMHGCTHARASTGVGAGVTGAMGTLKGCHKRDRLDGLHRRRGRTSTGVDGVSAVTACHFSALPADYPSLHGVFSFISKYMFPPSPSDSIEI